MPGHPRDPLRRRAAACGRGPHTAASIVPVLFGREFDAHQMMFALGESLAHLHALWHDGALVREVGADGVVRFSAA